MTAPVSPMLSETRLLLPATLHSPLRSTTNKRTLGDLHDGTPLIALPLLRFYLFSFISLFLRALVKCADCVDQPVLCPVAFPFWRSCNNNVLSSGLPLPAPWLSGALLLSAGRPEERGAGPVLLRFSVQPVPRICGVHRLGQRILQPSVLFHRSSHGIPVLHGKQRWSRRHSRGIVLDMECMNIA